MIERALRELGISVSSVMKLAEKLVDGAEKAKAALHAAATKKKPAAVAKKKPTKKPAKKSKGK